MPKQLKRVQPPKPALPVVDQLEIFQKAAMDLAEAGVSVRFGMMADGRLGVTLADVVVCPRCRKFRPAAQMVDSGTCQNCARITNEE